MATLYAKLIGAALLLVALASLCLWCHHAGARSVQAQWDAAKAAQAVAAVKASEAARTTEQDQSNAFAGAAADYLKVTDHAYPSLADAIPAAATAGTLQLRDDCPAVPAGGVPEAAARSRAAHAAAAAAATQRLADSVAAVRAGDAADARERELAAQVMALQTVLAAERRQ
jgi:hypothetical protein